MHTHFQTVKPVDFITVHYKDGKTECIPQGVVASITQSQTDLTFCNVSWKEIVDFLSEMSDIGEEFKVKLRSNREDEGDAKTPS